MNINLNNDEILFLKGDTGIVGIVKVAYENKMLFIGTPDNEEIVLFLEEDDLIAISSFNNTKKDEKAIKAMAFITREMDAPIIVLDENHPSSKRLPLVLSVGDKVKLDCNITPGTHPEQDILCSCDSLSGLIINKTENGVKLNQDFKNYDIQKF
ncbi:hypothetical protein LJB96_05665 [Methanobrevibacter sp. OttesenSCG-928-K11]|nr:hypothetical protein [Methanobrevibacter sp. OttesenSCG-928-K11]